MINLVAANQLSIQTYSTYTLCLNFINRHEKSATILCTYAAVKHFPDEPEILLEMPGLFHSQIIIDTVQNQ